MIFGWNKLFKKRKKELLYILLNLDPWEESDKFDNDAVRDAILSNPGAAKKKYDFKIWGGVYTIHPLFMAVALGASRDVIELICNACPEAIEQKDRKGIMPLHYAVHFKAPLDVVQLLTEKYPNALAVKSNGWYTPLELAKLYKASPEIVSYLTVQEQKYIIKQKRTAQSEYAAPTTPSSAVESLPKRPASAYAMLGGLAGETVSPLETAETTYESSFPQRGRKIHLEAIPEANSAHFGTQ